MENSKGLKNMLWCENAVIYAVALRRLYRGKEQRFVSSSRIDKELSRAWKNNIFRLSQ